MYSALFPLSHSIQLQGCTCPFQQEAELSFTHKHAFHTGMEIIRTMCCTNDGDVIVCGRIDTRRAEKEIEDTADAYEIHW